jgi:hypothetical protein
MRYSLHSRWRAVAMAGSPGTRQEIRAKKKSPEPYGSGDFPKGGR